MRNNKHWLIVSVIVLVGLLVFVFLSNKEKVYSGEVDILMTEEGFDRQETIIRKGTKVNFVNKDNGARWPASDLHPSHGIFPEFDPERPLKVGETWSFMFEKVGEWGMHDHISPYYVGVIKVID